MNQEVNHADRAHAEFSPSQLKNLKQCPGYHGRDGSSAASEMGTRIHEALEIRDPSSLQTEKEVDIYDVCVREEDLLFQNAFFGYDGVTINREERLVIQIDAKSEMFGTADVIAHKDNVCLIVDYKTGISEIDEPIDNWQAKAYALGVFQKYPAIDTVHFAFIVPQRYEVPYGQFLRSDMEALRADISKVVVAAETTRPKWAAGTMDIDDVNPSVNCCRFCRYEDSCPALGAICIDIAKRYKPALLPEGDIHVSNIDDPATLSMMFIVAKIVEDWASHVQFKVKAMADQGVEFPNLKRRSLGARMSVVDASGLAQYAMAKGLELYDIFEASNISVNKLAEKFANSAPHGKKTKYEKEFTEELIDGGFVKKGEVNYTLSIIK
jgi:hypothetical protein